jgi:hypothetical protein
MELMQSSKQSKLNESDSSVAKLLREKLSIANSMRNINEVLGYVSYIPIPRFYDFTFQASF